MDFALNDEQQMLQESARRFFAERHPLTRARQALPWSDATQQALWRDMADMGWLSLLVPEEHEGLGLGLCEAFLVAEAAGRQLLNLPLASSAVLLPLLLREAKAPNAALAQWVAELSTGQSAFQCTLDDAALRDHGAFPYMSLPHAIRAICYPYCFVCRCCCLWLPSRPASAWITRICENGGDARHCSARGKFFGRASGGV